MNMIIRLGKKQKKILLIGMAVILACSVALFTAIHLVQEKSPTRERNQVSDVDGIPMVEALLPDTLENRPGIKRKIKYVVIHETANHTAGADAKAHSDYLMKGGDGSTSWHYTVDDSQIYHHIPDNEVAWHAGDKLAEDGGNLNGIAIELCVNEDGSFNRTFDNGAKLTAYLLKEYRLSVEDIRQHHDFSGKNCPMTIRETDRWNEFLNLVREYLS